MTIVSALGLVIAGLALLAVGGELLVRGATLLARIAGLTPAVIGLTIVAIGTSLPELVVSVTASAKAEADLAIANVIGSNLVNITATLGLAGLILPLPTRTTVVRLEWPVLLVASAATLVTMRDGMIDRYEASFFLISLASFIAYAIHIARRDATRMEQEALADQVAEYTPRRARGIPYAAGLIVVGLALLIAGGDLLVNGAVDLAAFLGVSQRIIGLTVVAIGTGVPEIAATIVAAVRKEADLALGNLIGSNVFNLLGILGAAALVRPLRFDPALIRSDAWWMIGSVVLLLPLMLLRRRVDRREGALLLGVYATYLVLLIRAA
jgi:cation:H+ antiporter